MSFFEAQQQVQQAFEPINLTIILVTAVNGLFALISGILHVKSSASAATVRDGVMYVQASLRPPADRLEDTIRSGRPRV